MERSFPLALDRKLSRYPVGKRCARDTIVNGVDSAALPVIPGQRQGPAAGKYRGQTGIDQKLHSDRITGANQEGEARIQSRYWLWRKCGPLTPAKTQQTVRLRSGKSLSSRPFNHDVASAGTSCKRCPIHASSGRQQAGQRHGLNHLTEILNAINEDGGFDD